MNGGSLMETNVKINISNLGEIKELIDKLYKTDIRVEPVNKKEDVKVIDINEPINVFEAVDFFIIWQIKEIAKGRIDVNGNHTEALAKLVEARAKLNECQ